MLYRADKTSVWRSLDWWTVTLYVALAFIGCLSIYGASYDFDNAGFFDFTQRSGKQMLWLGLSLCIGIFILLIDANNYFSWAFLLYAGMMGVLLLTVFIAPDIKGSRSWLVIGPLNIQPAEFAKFATSLALARFMSSYNFNMSNPRNVIAIGGIILMPMMLIFLQNETGSALVFFALMLMLYREGMPGIILFLIVCFVSFFLVGIRFGEIHFLTYTSVGQMVVLLMILLVVCGMLLSYRKDHQSTKILLTLNLTFLGVGVLLNAFGWWMFNLCYLQLGLLVLSFLYLAFQSLGTRSSTYLMIGFFSVISAGFLYSTDYAFNDVLEPHQQIRIKVLLGMEDDPRGAGYNVNQSKIAIGSGGFFGKGFLNGTQTKLKYVPEQDTDFIFCTVGEEQGFVGSVGVLALYIALLLRLIILAERQESAFSRIYGYCVVSILFFHIFINVGMVLGLLPVIGIPLPFFSYGGSSLWAFTILLFIFLRLDADHQQRR
ncbi:MAG: rod shape-determining protein RodA [Bacteroidales bacterium]|nr:rod shape-determining protein RodA [Bacteroidales bacterium]